MQIDDGLLYPVEASGNHFVLSEEWIAANVPFPRIEERARLASRGYAMKSGYVHIDGVPFQARILYGAREGDQKYAEIRSGPDEDLTDIIEFQGVERERYANALRMLYEYSEAVMPEQRARIESDFVEPDLEIPGSPGPGISWGNIRGQSHILIVGPAGSGKTTLLRHWLLWHASRVEHGESDIVPICLQLRDFRPEETIEGALRRVAIGTNAEALASSLVGLAKRGRLALAFDGFDEVPAEDRQEALSEIQRFATQFPECRYMVTSRPEVELMLDIGLEQFRIKPFDGGRLRELAFHRLYGHDDWKTFTAKVQSDAALNRIATSPLAISMIVARQLRREIAPSFVTEIVGAVVEMLVDSWDSSRGIQRSRNHTISPSTKIKVLAYLASTIETQGSSESDIKFVAERISRLVPDISPALTLRIINEHTGLLAHDDGKWSFRDEVFQEYFAASSWVSSLGSKISEFMDEVVRPIAEKFSAKHRFMGYMSSDAADTIEQILMRAKSSDLSTVVRISDILSQNIYIPSATLQGYANLTLACLRDVVAPLWRDEESPGDREAASVLHLRLGKNGEIGRLELASLIEALHRAKDGVGGEALRSALLLQDGRFFQRLTTILQSDGNLKSAGDDSLVSFAVEDVLPEVAATGLDRSRRSPKSS